ncbi:MAG: CheR family methyltransferase [Vicingaceae bacterium]|nr:CheR family methyltransferase [Vicingaceae bacterium]
MNKFRLNDEEFVKLSSFIYSNFGIKLPITKKVLLEGRLQKRIKANQFNSFKEYIDFVFSEEGESEIISMIDQVSTNKTDFFREAKHFDFFREVVLENHLKFNDRNPIKVWSSAASSGEEIYTIAISIEEFNRQNNSKIDYTVLGTDISLEILQKAQNAVYTEDRVLNIPIEIKRRYFLRSKDKIKRTVKIIPEIRKKVRFQRLNLMDDNYAVDSDFDVVFCRNVLIYFDKETQEKVVKKQCSKLRVGGYFFLGHSESILGFDVPLKQIKPTVYMKI